MMDGNAALNRLLEGNKRFMTGKLAAKDVKTPREATRGGQKPFATILTCSDSRVSPELIFDANIGEIFVIRNAGNVVDPIVLGTMEYGVEHLHTPLVLVMGHEKCGAVTAACSGGVCPPNIQAIVDTLKPSADRCGCEVEKSATENVRCMLSRTRAESDIIREHEQHGKVKLVGARYSFETGKVEMLEEPPRK